MSKLLFMYMLFIVLIHGYKKEI